MDFGLVWFAKCTLYVYGHLSKTFNKFLSISVLKTLRMFNILVRGLSWLAKRYYSEQLFPKITTHYTVVPRETDSRWKGTYFLQLLITLFIILKDIIKINHWQTRIIEQCRTWEADSQLASDIPCPYGTKRLITISQETPDSVNSKSHVHFMLLKSFHRILPSPDFVTITFHVGRMF